jgi:hypothetical protein
MIFNHPQESLQRHLSELREANKVIERTLDHAMGAVWYKEEKRGLMELHEGKEEVDAFFARETDIAFRLLPRVMRAALFLASYGALDHYLVSLCDAHSQQHAGLSPSDLKGDGIERCRVYLTKVAAIAFPSESHQWQLLARCRVLRNVLAHSQGIIANRYLAPIQALKADLDRTYPPAHGIPDGRSRMLDLYDSVIHLEHEFNQLFLDTIDQFSQLLFGRLEVASEGH